MRRERARHERAGGEARGRGRAGGAVEVEERAGRKVHELLALAVEVERDLLRLRARAPRRRQPRVRSQGQAHERPSVDQGLLRAHPAVSTAPPPLPEEARPAGQRALVRKLSSALMNAQRAWTKPTRGLSTRYGTVRICGLLVVSSAHVSVWGDVKQSSRCMRAHQLV